VLKTGEWKIQFRFGSLPDIRDAKSHVRFTTESGICGATVHVPFGPGLHFYRLGECPFWVVSAFERRPTKNPEHFARGLPGPGPFNGSYVNAIVFSKGSIGSYDFSTGAGNLTVTNSPMYGATSPD
jgi:hypothetical protein